MGLLDAPVDLAGRARRDAAKRLRREVRATASPAQELASDIPTLAWSTEASGTPLTGGTVRTLNFKTNQSRFIGVPDDSSANYRANKVNTTDVTPLIEEFDFTGTNFSYLYRANITTSYWQVYVDGLPIAAAPFQAVGTITAGTLYRLAVTFGSAGTRRIRIEAVTASRRGFEYIDGDSITPTPTVGDLWLMMGDSFVQGANGITDLTSFCHRLGRMLPEVELVNCGQGGTGYTNAGSGKWTYANATRLSFAAQMKPDVAIIFGSVNDMSATTSALSTAAASCYSQWASLSPDTKLIVIGVQRALSAQAATAAALNAAMKTAALAAPNVLGFIDPLTGTWEAKNGRTGGNASAYFIGSGYSSSPNADDSTMTISSDNVHPTQVGHDHLARRVFADVTDLLAVA